MGLESVEFIIATEVAFGVEIPDSDFVQVDTPRKLITYLRGQLPASDHPSCLIQQAFYRIRNSVVEETGVPRAAVRPSTELDAVLPGVTRWQAWRSWGRSIGVESWPSLPGTGWFGRVTNRGRATLGAAARHLATYGPAAVKRGAGWTDREIEMCVVALIEAELGVDMSQHTLDAEFVRDLGVD